MFGHPKPFFAPIVAVICLGTSYGQRLRRVAEVTIGVAIGVFLADLLLLLIGTGAWQVSVLVALAMTITLLLNAGTLFVTQAAVQGIVVVTFAAAPGYALTRWLDALIGGAVALVGRGRRPPRAAAASARAGRARRTPDRAAAAGRGAERRGRRRRARPAGARRRPQHRPADPRAAGRRRRGPVGAGVLAVPAPARRPRPADGRARRAARPGAAQHPGAGAAGGAEQLPPPCRCRVPYVLLCEDLADAVDEMADELRGRARWPLARCARSLLRVGEGTAEVERVADLSADVVLAQIRSIIVDLLQITGMDVLEATDALPHAAA